ncbi:MAG: double zinc ribbon domain-containing protein [Dehalogenimonas sp.]
MSTADKGHNIVTCTRCRTNIDTAIAGGDVKFCPNCGNQLFTPPPQHKTNYCPGCGKALSAPFDFCPGCGTRLNDEAVADKYTSPEDYPPTPAELAAAKKGFVPPPTAENSTGHNQIVTDPKLKKLYKQWAAYSDLPEEAMPVMEKPRPVQAPHRPASFQLSGFLADIPPRYLFIGGVVIIALVLLLIIIIIL